MMFIVRTPTGTPPVAGVQLKLTRRTPPLVATAPGQSDFFCVADAPAIAGLRDAGLTVVELHDGYYEDDAGGGVAIWGQGRYWEIRDTPFTVKEAVGPAGQAVEAPAGGEHVNVRGAIFGV
ncbi:MAG TPA: hypothetical protein VKQ73_14740 [Stellaceae bacterium]|nr:hypothetical protein [Stellaceae bacterium]